VGQHIYFIYILTNPGKTTLYVGVTNNLTRRIKEHTENKGKFKTFAGRHYCNQLIYYEQFKYINNAIAREKQIKRWSRKKKENLIATMNPKWSILNAQFYDSDYYE